MCQKLYQVLEIWREAIKVPVYITQSLYYTEFILQSLYYRIYITTRWTCEQRDEENEGESCDNPEAKHSKLRDNQNFPESHLTQSKKAMIFTRIKCLPSEITIRKL